MHPELPESQRFPLLSPAGRRFLHALRQDSAAPIWNWPNGEQLDAAGLEQVQTFAERLRTVAPRDSDRPPDWLAGFVDFCLEVVPFYRDRSPPGTPFRSVPSFCREDLAGRTWEFVPDSQPLERMIVFSSSGTTGHPARIPSHPATVAAGIPLLERAMAHTGARFARGVDQMALTNIASYRGAYTTAIVVAYLEEAGCVRVNLCDEDWRSPGDCASFMNRWGAEVMLGDPVALAELARVPLVAPPRVMISSIMSLSDALAAELAARYGCHVLDVYALTEAGIVALKTPQGHEILPPDLHVELLGEHDEPCPPGVRGEITLTGGRNPFLPLLRFRTGDFAAWEWHDRRPMLVGLEGRRPVAFTATSQRVVHSMEVTRALRGLPLLQFQLHQDAQGHFHFRYRGLVDENQVRAVLGLLLGADASLTIDSLPLDTSVGRKVVQYRCDLL